MNLTQLADAIIAQDAELQRLQRKCYLLEPIARAADELERFLAQNTGNDGDCVVQVHDNPLENERDEMFELLTDLFFNLKPWRAERKNE